MIDTENIDVIGSIDAFEFNKVFFTDPETFSKLTDKAKTQNVWTFYRTLAIENPIGVNSFQHVRTPDMVSHLHHQLKSDRIPQYVYTKNLRNNNTSKPFLSTISVDVKREYVKSKDIEYKSLDDLYRLFPEETTAEINELKSVLEQKTKKRKTKTRKK